MGFSKKTAANDSQQMVEALKKGEAVMAESAKEIMGLASSISNFDVGMSHMSKALVDISNQIEDVSESNVAVVEETVASMTSVNDAILASNTKIAELSQDSSSLTKSNNTSLNSVLELEKLKDSVIEDNSDMKDCIQTLVKLTNEISRIVDSVQEIASQTNLLALNAAIEAARAGDAGRGFAVVAEQVRVLADNTKTSLAGMTKFVEDIQHAAAKSETSMERTVTSTADMGEKIEVLADVMNKNSQKLENVTNHIDQLNVSMENIKSSASEVLKAMDCASEESIKLSDMVGTLKEDATESLRVAQGVSEIDDKLSSVTERLFETINEGSKSVTNEEFLAVVQNARKAHITWLDLLRSMRDEHKVKPIQTNANKCTFGHYYSALRVTNAQIADEWNKIKTLHLTFHSLGDEVIAAIYAADEEKASMICQEAEEMSVKLIEKLDFIEEKVKEMTQRKENVF